jgi:hypothetical protein
MRGLASIASALALASPLAAAGGPLPPPEHSYSPRFVGKAADYGWAFDLSGVKVKTALIGRDCPSRRRGIVFKSTQPSGLGFGQVFPDANTKREPVTIDVLIDPSKLDPGGRAVVELDSPFVPIGGQFDAFVILAVDRLNDRSLSARAFAPGGLQLGTTSVFPEDTGGITGTFTYENDAVDVAVGACTGLNVPIVTDHPLVFAGSSGLGLGILGNPGDSAGFAIEVTGDLFDAQKQDVLEDLQALIDLENAAAADLGAGNGAAAKTKLEQARQRLTTQGPPIPNTDPQQFEDPLVTKLQALPASDARDDAVKRLQKANEKDGSAIEKIDDGKNDKAAKRVEQAVSEKLRAKAVIETGVVAEGKGKL